MPSAIVDALDITRRHGPRTVLDGVSLRVDRSSRVGLIGPNGAGKSTLLRVLAGLEPPDGGHVRRRGTIGYLPQLADAARWCGAARSRSARSMSASSTAGGCSSRAPTAPASRRCSRRSPARCRSRPAGAARSRARSSHSSASGGRRWRSTGRSARRSAS